MAEIKEITSIKDYTEFTNNPNSLNIIKIGTSWCGPCRLIEETLKNLTQEEVEGVMLAEINADDDWFEDVSVELGIRGIPVLLAFKDGAVRDRLQGAAPKDKILSFFEENK